MVFRAFRATGTGFFSRRRSFFINSRPGTPGGFFRWHPTFFVSFFDVLGFALLLAYVTGFIAFGA